MSAEQTPPQGGKGGGGFIKKMTGKALAGKKRLMIAGVLIVGGAAMGLMMLIGSLFTQSVVTEGSGANKQKDTCVTTTSVDISDLPNISDLPDEQMHTVKTMWARFKEDGWSDEAAAGVIGNAWKESFFTPGLDNRYNPQPVNGESLGCIGLWQWCNLVDKQGLAAMPGGWQSLDNQLTYFLDQMTKGEVSTWWQQKYNGSLVDYYFESGKAPAGQWFASYEDFKTSTDIDLVTAVFVGQWEIPCPSDGVYGNKDWGYPLPRPANACWLAETKQRAGYGRTIYEAFSGKTASATTNTDCEPKAGQCGGDAGVIQDFIDETIENPSITYVWATHGPDHYDCSGWVTSAFNLIGVHTGSYTGDMATILPGIAQKIPGGEANMDKWKWGDIILYTGPDYPHHTALYIGDGKMAHFTLPGQPGKITDVKWSPKMLLADVWRVVDFDCEPGDGGADLGAVSKTGWANPTPGSFPGPGGAFGACRPLGGCSRSHEGQDVAAPINTRILAAQDGVVSFSGPYFGCGYRVVVDHGTFNGKKLQTCYCHMANQPPVKVGQKVKAGDFLGPVGGTGSNLSNSDYGHHLHFEVRVDGVAINPVPFMQERGISLGVNPK